MPIAVTKTILFLFQMTTLPGFHKHLASGRMIVKQRRRTYGAQSTEKRQQRRDKQITKGKKEKSCASCVVGCANKNLTASNVTQSLETWLVRRYNGLCVEHGTHLTVYRGCSIKADHVENYGQKGRHARDGVNL